VIERCGHGIEAMRQFLDMLFSTGVEKIAAGYFADNLRVRAFLRKLGAEDEGYLKAHTVRNGERIDMRQVAFHKEQYLCHSAAL